MYIKNLSKEFISNWLFQATETIQIYSPWITNFGTEILFDIFKSKPNISVELYFRFCQIDILQGFIDLIGLNNLKREGFNLKFFEYHDLHAKIYIIDKQKVISGSCNFTEKGFVTNYEIAYETEYCDDLKKIISNWDFKQVNQIQINNMLFEINKLKEKISTKNIDINEIIDSDFKFHLYSLGLR